MKYVIIGNSAAAIGAVEGIRKVDQQGSITLISSEPYHTYSRPLISYWLGGKVTEANMVYRKLDFYKKNNVETILGVSATAVDTQGKQVVLADGRQIPYDKVLVATGGKPFVPPTPGLDETNVHTFIKMDDVKALKERAVPGSKTVIIGAGLIGLKAAEGLAKLGVDITVVELANRVLSAILDEEAAAKVQQHLEQQGIKFELNTTVETVAGQDQATGVVLKNGKTLDCDFLIVAIGVVPNTDVIANTNIKINRGIQVDDTLATNVAEVYAAGDVSEGYDIIYQANRVLPILPNAYRQGEVAGLNMAGQVTHYPGGFAMNAIGFFGMSMITAGIIKPEGEEFEILTQVDDQGQQYKKIILRDNKIVGFIYLNAVDRAGIMTGLIESQEDVSSFKAHLLAEDFGYNYFPADMRKAKLLKGRAAV